MPILNPGESDVRMDVSTGLNGKFDIIQNCELLPRKSDVGVLQDKMMLARRKGTSKFGTSHSPVNNSASAIDARNALTFYTGTGGNRNAYKSYGGRVYKLVGIVWTEILTPFASATSKITFNTVSVPHGNESTTFATPAVATGIEKIKVSASDTSPASNRGKYVYVMNGTYAHKYAYVSGYDAGNGEYLLEGLGNTTAIASGTSYEIFDRTRNLLQIWIDGKDVYYDGTNYVSTFEYNIYNHFKTYFNEVSIQNVFAFDGYLWVNSSNTLFRSEAKNYFYFPFNGVVDHSQFDSISNTFVWKDKLIVGGVGGSIVTYKRSSVDSNEFYVPNLISANYGIVTGGINDFEKDVYFLTTSNELISLSENQTGIVFPTNVGKPMMNYIKDFKYNVTSGFDGRKFYLYGEKVSGTTGTTIVYDTVGKFWGTIEGIPFSTIVQEGNATYFTLHNDSRCLTFDSTSLNDDGNPIVQIASTVGLDGGDPFVVKEKGDVSIMVENPGSGNSRTFTIIDSYMLNGRNGVTQEKVQTVTGISNTPFYGSLEMPLNIMLNKKGDKTGVNMRKITLVGTGVDGALNKFELDEITVVQGVMKSDYNRPDYAI